MFQAHEQGFDTDPNKIYWIKPLRKILFAPKINSIDLMLKLPSGTSKKLLVNNAYSISDVNWHLQYLADYFKFTPKLGLNIISKNFVIYIYNAVGFPDAHNSFPSKTFLPVLLWLSNLLKNNPDDLQKYEQLFLLFNEFYFEEYNYKEKLLQKINNQTSEYAYR